MIASCPKCSFVGPARLTPVTKDWVCASCGEWNNLRIVQYCTKCGFIGVPSLDTVVNYLVLVLLFICGVIPGIIYLIFFRRQFYICPGCGGRQTVVPADSPVAQEKLRGRRVPWADPSLVGDSATETISKGILPTHQIRFCTGCGAPLAADDQFCGSCGKVRRGTEAE